MADLTSKVISSNFQRLLQVDDGVIQDGTGSAYALRVSGSTKVGINTDPVADATLKVGGDIKATGNIIAEQYVVSSSVTYLTQSFSSGSTIFGNSSDDLHQFTGSLTVLGSITSSGHISGSTTASFGYVHVFGELTASKVTVEGETLVIGNQTFKDTSGKLVLTSGSTQMAKLEGDGYLILSSSGTDGTRPQLSLKDDYSNAFILNKNRIRILETESTKGWTIGILPSGSADGANPSKYKTLGNVYSSSAGDFQFSDSFTAFQSVNPILHISHSTGNIGIHDFPTGDNKLRISGSVALVGADGHITASGNISASGTVFADSFQSATGGSGIDFNDDLDVDGHITASGNIKADGNISSSGQLYGNILNARTRVKAIGSSLEFAGNELDFVDGNSTRYLLRGIDGGAFEAYHSGNKKLETTAGGIDVTGNITASNIEITGSNPRLRVANDGTATGDPTIQFYRNDLSYAQIHYETGGGVDAGVHFTDFRDDANSQFIFNTRGDSEKMRIESDGKVGIGTTTPEKELTVEGDISMSGDIYLGPINEGGNIKGRRDGTGNEGYINVSGEITLASDGDIFFKETDASPDLRTHHFSVNSGTANINTGSNEANDLGQKLYVKGGITTTSHITASGNISASGTLHSFGGNIGIGTTSPTIPLEVNKGDTTQIISDRDGNGSNIVLKRSGTTKLTLATSNTSGQEAQLIADGDLLLNGTAGDNVGIGTTSPGKKLTVKGDISASGQIHLYGGGTPGGLRFTNTNTYITASSTTSDSGLRFGSGGDFKFYMDMDADGTNEFAIHSHEAVTGSANQLFTVLDTGDVGIGTSSPTRFFHVKSADAVAALIESSNTTNAMMDISSSAADGGAGIRLSAPDNKWVFGASGSSFIIADGMSNISAMPDNTKRVTIDSSGNVGIGIIDPDSNLYVLGDSGVRIRKDATGAGNSTGIRMGVHDSDIIKSAIQFVRKGTNGTGDIQFWVDSATDTNDVGSSDVKMTISGSGAVGIGTTEPTALLEVRGDSQALAMFSGSAYTIEFDHAGQEKFDLSHGTSGIYWRKSNTTIAGYTQNHDFSLFNNSGTGYANFDGSGERFHIGTALSTIPAATIDVRGDISSSGFISTLSHITASGKISASGTITAPQFFVKEGKATYVGSTDSGDDLVLEAADDIRIRPTDDVLIYANDDSVYVQMDGVNKRVGINNGVPTKALTVGGSISCSNDIFLESNNYLAMNNTNNNNPSYIRNYGTNVSDISFLVGGSGVSNQMMKMQNAGVTINSSKTKPTNNTLGVYGSVFASGSTDGHISASGGMQINGAVVDFTGLPTSDPGIAGRLWNDSNTLKISAG